MSKDHFWNMYTFQIIFIIQIYLYLAPNFQRGELVTTRNQDFLNNKKTRKIIFLINVTNY